MIEHGAPFDGDLRQLLQEGYEKSLALFVAAEGGAAGRFGGGAGGGLRLGEEMQRVACAGGDHLLDGQSILTGFAGLQLGAEHFPGLGFVPDHDRAGAGRVGVERFLADRAFVGVAVFAAHQEYE